MEKLRVFNKDDKYTYRPNLTFEMYIYIYFKLINRLQPDSLYSSIIIVENIINACIIKYIRISLFIYTQRILNFYEQNEIAANAIAFLWNNNNITQ